MKMDVFAIFDEKAGVYAVPFFMQNEGLAIRAFGDLCEDSKSAANRHPNDYKLYKIGEYDDVTGALFSVPNAKFLAHGSNFVQFIERSV